MAEHPWIAEVRTRMVDLNRQAKEIDPSRGYDSERKWRELHEEIGYCQDMLAYLLAGGRDFTLRNGRLVPGEDPASNVLESR